MYFDALVKIKWEIEENLIIEVIGLYEFKKEKENELLNLLESK